MSERSAFRNLVSESFASIERKNTVKTKEELNAIKEEVETLNKKLAELTEEELKQVNGGHEVDFGSYEVAKVIYP